MTSIVRLWSMSTSPFGFLVAGSGMTPAESKVADDVPFDIMHYVFLRIQCQTLSAWLMQVRAHRTSPHLHDVVLG